MGAAFPPGRDAGPEVDPITPQGSEEDTQCLTYQVATAKKGRYTMPL